MQSLNVDNRQENKQDNKTPLISRHSSKNFSSFASLTTASRSYNLMFIVQITLIVAMGGFIFGYDTGIIGGAALYFVDDFPLITSGEKETIVSLAIIGAAFGCLLIGPFSDNYGRKLSIILADFFFAAGAFLVFFLSIKKNFIFMFFTIDVFCCRFAYVNGWPFYCRGLFQIPFNFFKFFLFVIADGDRSCVCCRSHIFG